jgi:hypothetical protein
VPFGSGKEFLVTPAVYHRALDGAVARFEGSALDLSEPASSFILSAGQEFGSGPWGWGQQLAGHLGIHSFDERYSFQNGVLLMAHGVQDGLDDDPTHFVYAIWEGQYASIKSPFYPIRTSLGSTRLPTSSEILATWGLFEVSEDATGASLTPVARDLTPVLSSGPYAPDVVKVVPGVGRLDVIGLTAALRKQLPAGSGLSVAGGELFVRDQDRRLLVLVGESALTTIYAEREVSDSSVLSALDGLVVDWVFPAAEAA